MSDAEDTPAQYFGRFCEEFGLPEELLLSVATNDGVIDELASDRRLGAGVGRRERSCEAAVVGGAQLAAHQPRGGLMPLCLH